MGFSNEYLTEEEKALIANTRHILLTRKNGNVYECIPDMATVDREKKIWMIRILDGYSHEVGEERFIIFYGDILKDNIINLYIQNIGSESEKDNKDGSFIKEIKYWKINELKFSDKIKNKQCEINKKLEEMMTAYALSGHPRQNAFQGQYKAIIKEIK